MSSLTREERTVAYLTGLGAAVLGGSDYETKEVGPISLQRTMAWFCVSIIQGTRVVDWLPVYVLRPEHLRNVDDPKPLYDMIETTVIPALEEHLVQRAVSQTQRLAL